MIFYITISALLALTSARPNEFTSKNVVVVPQNCPTGQVWLNNQCRELWRLLQIQDVPLENLGAISNVLDSENERNVVTVPPNCPEGQEWFNGACREVWTELSEDLAPNEHVIGAVSNVLDSENERNVVTVPPNCPEGQVWVNDACREVWTELSEDLAPIEHVIEPVSNALSPNSGRNVVTVPTNCPTGQEWYNGQCREVWARISENLAPMESELTPVSDALDVENRNVVSVPQNCPTGQEWYNGACRDVWAIILENLAITSVSNALDVENKNVVTVPQNCPTGQEWYNGACRDVWAFLTNNLAPMEQIIDQQVSHMIAESDNQVQKVNQKNIISVPNQCPQGYKADSNGICRIIFEIL